ncbi:MAG: hypothetical protein IJ014_03000 [Rikenellaceae bacterium]|nr:hypothetical protein [Rikenellaceae bacterium]
MTKKLMTLMCCLLGVLSLAAQTTTVKLKSTQVVSNTWELELGTSQDKVVANTADRGVVVRASGTFSMLNIHFPEFPNRFQLGGGVTLSAAYEHPIALRGVIGAGVGGSFDKTVALDKTYYYRNLSLSSVYAEVYYGFKAQNGFFLNLGIQGGYTPPVLSLTAAPEWEGGLKLRRLSPYQCKGGNVWFVGRVGYCYEAWEFALSLRYAMVSQFGEAFSYPMLTTEQESSYRDVRSRHLTAGFSVGYRFGL